MNPLTDGDALRGALDLGGAVVTAVLVLLGVRYTAKSSAKSSGRQVEVSERQVDVEEWRGLVSDLKDEVRRLSGRVDALESRREADGARIDSLTAEVRSGEAKYAVLLAYLREVLTWARTAAPGHSPPPAPAAVASELPL